MELSRMPLLPHPSRKTASVRFPLKDHAEKLTDLRSPRWRSLGKFLKPPFHSAFCSVRSPALSPTRAASPNAPFRSRLWKFTSEPEILITRVCRCSCPPLTPA
jgi:hypothetical protein